MKKIFLLAAICACSQYISAQEPADALRYSWTTSSGTARQQAIGGAMTSLGGDISATFVNPAGLGFYKTGDFVLLLVITFLKTKLLITADRKKTKEIVFPSAHLVL